MADSIVYLAPEDAKAQLEASRKRVEKRKKVLASTGAKSFEAIYIDENGKPRSDVHG